MSYVAATTIEMTCVAATKYSSTVATTKDSSNAATNKDSSTIAQEDNFASREDNVTKEENFITI
jgi:hypothetical protein